MIDHFNCFKEIGKANYFTNSDLSSQIVDNYNENTLQNYLSLNLELQFLSNSFQHAIRFNLCEDLHFLSRIHEMFQTYNGFFRCLDFTTTNTISYLIGKFIKTKKRKLIQTKYLGFTKSTVVLDLKHTFVEPLEIMEPVW